jgi:hypothetical protein
MNRMIQMEMEPKELLDPRLTELLEAGTDRKYYVNLTDFNIQLFPGQYKLPRGGIL